MNTDKPLLKDTGRGLTISYKNKYLYSKYNPLKSITRYINDIVLNDLTIYILPSPLLGYGLEEIRQHIPKTSLLITIEADQNLYNLSDIDDLCLVSKGFDILTLYNKIDFSRYKRCELIKLNGGYDLNKEIYDRIYRVLLNQLQNYWRNRLTLTKMGQLWIKNTLTNLKTIKNSKELTELKTEKPVVVIGAGESVESVLNTLKGNREFLYLLCVDTALQILLEADIMPNAVLALEAQYYNLPDFYGSKNLEIDLIYDLSSYPGVIKTLNGNKYYTLTDFSDSSLIKRIKENGLISKTLPPMGSVGITALYTALLITDNYVFTCGLDFSYTLGKTHSRGTPYHITSLIQWNRKNPGYTIGGCLKRPLVKKKNKIGVLENSDNILYDYSLQAKELLYNCDRIFDITKKGMDLGIQLLNKEDFQYYIKHKCNVDINNLSSKKKDGDNLYIKELSLLEKGINTLRDLIDNKCSTQVAVSVLKDADYFFDHYPEPDPLRKLNNNNAERYYYTLMRFKRLLTGSM